MNTLTTLLEFRTWTNWLVTSPRDLGIVDIRNCLFEPSTGTCQSSNKVPSSNLFGERFWKKHQVWSRTRLQTCRGKWNYWNRIFGCQSLQCPRHCLADRDRRRMRHWVGVSKTWSPSWRVFGLNLKSQKKNCKTGTHPEVLQNFQKVLVQLEECFRSAIIAIGFWQIRISSKWFYQNGFSGSKFKFLQISIGSRWKA